MSRWRRRLARRSGRPPASPSAPDDAIAECLRVFDADYYAAQVPGLGAHDAWAYYLHAADAELRDPSPYFSTSYYREHTNVQTGRPALLDYVMRFLEGIERPVHPLFDAAFYRRRYPEIGTDAAFMHFVVHGDADCRRPSAQFDADFYRHAYLPLRAVRPLRHYLVDGAAKGYLPRPIPRDHDESSDALRDLLSGASVVLVGHDAQPSGGAMTVAMIARELSARGRSPVIVLRRGGPMIDDYRLLAPTVLLLEGWDRRGLWDAIPPGTPVIVNTAVGADFAAEIAQAGHQPLLLVHEFPEVIEALGATAVCRAAIEAGVDIGFALPAVRDAFDAAFRPSDRSRLHVFGFALYESAPEAGDYEQARDMLGPGTIVAGAGYADQRKGFDLFLQVAAQVHERRPDIRIVWFGDLGSWAETLAADAIGHGLPLELRGHVTPFQAWIAACDLLLVTSRSDVGPGTVLYAGVEGVPIVAFDTELGAAEHLRSVGALVPEGDVQAAVDRILTLLTADSDEMRDARVALARTFSVAPYVDRLLAVADA